MAKKELPEVLGTTLRSFYATVPGFPEWSAYENGRNGSIDPLTWLKSVSAEAHSQAHEWVHKESGMPLIGIAQPLCQSSAIISYVEGIPVDERAALFDTFGPIPLSIVGHLLVVAHCVPSEVLPKHMSRALCAPVLVSADDYLRLRDEFLDLGLPRIRGHGDERLMWLVADRFEVERRAIAQ